MTLAEELQELLAAASFTIADMAVWCDRDYSALRNWVQDGVIPHPVHQRYLRQSMELLNWALRKIGKLPIPSNVRYKDRAAYVKEVREYASREFSKRSTAERRG